ncbi:uncharacterized protein Z520_09320 [Fonsecaea multimorphosa CBS 102226]|uniref:SAP domain-containing protein n=1 Tax=Fonsecaea multimorphosa CBS 102226 TaxID=1442371 RepID=A0A0D2GZP4_9EURO|nr:uncharacterized protein Z520_09320 [Fonsecaea multimorphosa CBS 102226]KIX95010.1 hypothetical protein Z520_09320 [Fonsecaea multimorphosa CBS 102226]OAL20658.1 hypothetical protein AYO22_08667 [Fonsecaea multimorphosa]
MTDWSKLKVADLKEECKSRDIPLTGLKLKQQYIDKLEEYEAQNEDQSTKNGVENGQDSEEVEEQSPPQENGHSGEGTHPDPGTNDTEKDEGLKDASRRNHPAAGEDEGGADKPSAIQEEDSQAEALTKTEEQPIAEASPQPDEIGTKDEPGIIPKKTEEKLETTEAPEQSDDAVDRAEKPTKAEATTIDQSGETKSTAVLSTPPSTENQSDSNTPHSSQIPSSDLAEDQRKRRKRSATPVPSTQDAARKRARLAEEAEDVKAEEAPEPTEAEVEEAKESPGEPMNREPAEVVVKTSDDGAVIREPLSNLEETNPGQPEANDTRVSTSPPRSTASFEDRDIPPAIHPATSSIYIRNFKRPLHIPSLRAHIASIAKSRSSENTDPVITFYLDSIRTHAFVSFTSIAAASRVRSAMHGSRFPDEPLREPLFVDYVPPNKVQTWIDQETGSGFGRGGGSGRRFEVVYEQGESSGIEAIFQEVDTSKPRPPPFEPSRGVSFDRQQQSESFSAGGVRPSREALIPHDNQHNRDHRQRGQLPAGGPPHNPSSSNNGTGFKALDELFDSTSTKPKLYYKPVPSSVATERLDMFRALRPGWEEMGRSGDEGMKRFSFERDKGAEEWVDKGPEFGFGRKGQSRLVGVGAGGGRGRGGGGGYRGRAVDSWRGGGR